MALQIAKRITNETKPYLLSGGFLPLLFFGLAPQTLLDEVAGETTDRVPLLVPVPSGGVKHSLA